MKTPWYLTVILLVTFLPLAPAPAAGAAKEPKQPKKLISSELSGRDLKFLQGMNVTLQAQQRIAAQTAAKAKKQKVADFAGTVDRELSQEVTALRDVAKDQGVILTEKLPDTERAKVEEFSKMESPEIDVAFLEELIRSRTEQIPMFEEGAASSVKALQSFCMDAMNAVKEHLLYVQILTKEGMESPVVPEAGQPAPPMPVAPPDSEPMAPPQPDASGVTEPASTPIPEPVMP